MEVVQLLGSLGFWQHQVLRGVGGWGSRKYSALEVYGNQSWPIHSSILAWRTPSLTEKPGRPQSTGWQRVRQDGSHPACINTRLFFAPPPFFACGSSAPVRVEREGGTAAWLAGILAVPSVQGHRLPPLQELWTYQSLFSSWRSEDLFG